MLKDLINEYREIILGPVIDVMNEDIEHMNDLDKKKEIQHKIDALISAWDETARDVLNGEAPDDRTKRAVDIIASEWIQDREYPEAGDIIEDVLKEQSDKD